MINIRPKHIPFPSLNKIKNIHELGFSLDTEITHLRNDLLKILTNDLSFHSFGNLLCKRIQAIIPSAYVSLCCIENEKMIPWAAPDIDSGYGASYAGLKIGENVGNCGSAAYLKQPIIVEDIKTDPHWENYKDVALPYGLQACCSYPIKDNLDNVVATFAFYFKEKIDVESETLLKIANAGIEFCLLAIDQENNRKTIRNLTFFDQLTGLPNRNNLLHHIDQYAQDQSSIFMIDIDHFKEVNLLIGYAFGDQLLKRLGEKLRTKLKDQFFLSRLERDIFIVVTPYQTCNEAEKTAQNILNWIGSEINIANHSLLLTASIGFSQYNQADKTSWLSQCKSALYQVKSNNGNSYACFSKGIGENEKQKSYLSQLVRKALLDEKLELFYQPQVDIKKNELYGLEALVRLRHPITKEFISPNQFIPIIEETGQMDKLSYWVIHQVCNQLKIWDENNVCIPKISINLSASNFENPNLSNYISSELEKNALSGSRLTLEITEDTMISLSEPMLKNISTIKELGIHLSIDDFGTGYSNLSNLINLPVNEIKIDRSFIEKINEDQKYNTLVSTMINLAANLNLNIVAEGVEKIEQYQFLKKSNCNIIQGYYYAKPIPKHLIENWINKDRLKNSSDHN